MQAQKKNESNHRRSYIPKPETVALLKVSGNPINGLGETAARKASPFFWDPPDQHPYGELQVAARQSSRRCPGAAPAFMAAYNHPELIPIAGEQIKCRTARRRNNEFVLSHEADAIGIAAMDPLYVFEGYQIEEPWVIILALAHNYDRLKQAPSDETNGTGVTDVDDPYARQRVAADSAGDCRWLGRTGETRLPDQPPFRSRRAASGGYDRHAAGAHRP
jgi:epoxyqueuosine reductase